MLKGHYGFYIEEGEKGLVTDSAVMIEYSTADTLWLNADTLYSFAEDTNKVVIGYHNVRFYREDMQGVCDSMSFYSVDTILRMMNHPLLWSDNNQMGGDTINFYIKDETLDMVHIINNGFISQEEDTVHYNQISGKEIYCYINDSTLRQVEVKGNSHSVFFPKDSLGYIGMNVIESAYMNAFFKDGEIEKMVVYPTPEAKMRRLSSVKKEEKYLPNFSWMEYIRPKDKWDIFSRPKIDEGLKEKEENKEKIKQMEREKREKEREQQIEERRKS